MDTCLGEAVGSFLGRSFCKHHLKMCFSETLKGKRFKRVPNCAVHKGPAKPGMRWGIYVEKI